MGKRIAMVVTLLMTTLLTIVILRGVQDSASAGSKVAVPVEASEVIEATTTVDPNRTTENPQPTSTSPTSLTSLTSTSLTSLTDSTTTTRATTTTSNSDVTRPSRCETSSRDQFCYPTTPAGLWATGTGPEAFTIGGAGATIDLPIATRGGLFIRGAGHQVIGGVRYGGSVRVTGANQRLKAPVMRDDNLTPPPYLHAEDFTTDSAAVLEPRIVSKKSCADGTWYVSVENLRDDTVYLAGCDVQLSGSGEKKVSIVSTGSITVTGGRVRLFGPFADSVVTNTLTAAGPITISGAGVEVNGLVVSDTVVTFGGAGTSVCGGVYAPSIEISGANFAAKSCDLG
jgi:hypothetical protein